MPAHPTRPEIRLLAAEFYAAQPLEHYAWMRENAPVYRDETAGVWGVTRQADVMSISKTPELFCSAQSSRPEPSSWVPSMINMDDPRHKRRRNLVNHGFTPKRVSDQQAKVREICVELIEKVATRGSCEFVREVAAPLPMAMIGDMLGVEPEDRDKLLRWSDDLLLLTTSTFTPEMEEISVRVGTEYATYVLGVVADRRQSPRDDLMSVLVHAAPIVSRRKSRRSGLVACQRFTWRGRSSTITRIEPSSFISHPNVGRFVPFKIDS